MNKIDSARVHPVSFRFRLFSVNCLERLGLGSNNDAIERLERQLAENKEKVTVGGRTHGAGRRSRSSWREAEFSTGEVDEPNPTGNREGIKRGGRVERVPLVVERWLHDEISKEEMDNESKEDVRLDKRPCGRMPIYGQQRELWRGATVYEGDRQRERHHRGPRKPKVDFPHFDGGDPHEWLDKVKHYFQVYEVARANRVSTACIYLDGKANS
ncbi:hypothetical protein LWI29_015567 [Acer saccharum]|uniref:Uncharacterized protein n=1 Tax=Acer saccharum TaxID=4024 RepID=A0AA39VY13_ACESA|nr:hypothetical protein LWI29_015567 [Acer saccharum]